ncbi:hypothetical protein C2E31_21240 [Rhodopirellula baltica]|nr:hypothetical protein C2E31_21240 [Rhodopirellula baltica]
MHGTARLALLPNVLRLLNSQAQAGGSRGRAFESWRDAVFANTVFASGKRTPNVDPSRVSLTRRQPLHNGERLDACKTPLKDSKNSIFRMPSGSPTGGKLAVV